MSIPSNTPELARGGSASDYLGLKGVGLEQRVADFAGWYDARVQAGLWSYDKTAEAVPVGEAFAIAFSDEGDRRRASLFAAIDTVRGAMIKGGAQLFGVASPIGPMVIGSEIEARVTSHFCSEQGRAGQSREIPSRRAARHAFGCKFRPTVTQASPPPR